MKIYIQVSQLYTWQLNRIDFYANDMLLLLCSFINVLNVVDKINNIILICR
jgi:hypothetical protein